MAETIKWPFGKATVVTPEYAASVAIEVENNKTVVKLPALTGAIELEITAHAELGVGAEVLVIADQGATGRNVTFAGEAVGDGITGVANDKDVAKLEYDGAQFRVVGIYKTVDAA